MSVPKKKRKMSGFEVFHHFKDTRKEITEYLINNFKYNEEKTLKKAQKKCGIQDINDLENTTEEKLRQYDIEVERIKSFADWYIPFERNEIMRSLQQIDLKLEEANSVVIVNAMTWEKRMDLQFEALGYINHIESEFEALAQILPINLNRITSLTLKLDREKKLINGWKKSDKKRAEGKGIFLDEESENIYIEQHYLDKDVSLDNLNQEEPF